MNTPKSLRLQIGIFGRRNVGKSSILNALTRQDVSIVSSEKGTTTDPVEKAMELQPLGPVLFIDTAGIDDEGELGALRVQKTRAIYDRCDLALIVTDGVWGEDEIQLVETFRRRQTPLIAVLNQSDCHSYDVLQAQLSSEGIDTVVMSMRDGVGVESLLESMIAHAPSEFLESRSMLEGLVAPNDHVLLVVPIDKEAPKGRLILPQVQTIRAILDSAATCTVCRETQVAQTIASMKAAPKLVITDSQVFETVNAQLPREIPLTGFSVLFARLKGDLKTLAEGAKKISSLREGDKVLIAEACTHHPIQEDIGRVKLPNWLRKAVGVDLQIDVMSGVAFPENLGEYDLVIHCGACMWNRRQMLSRIHKAQRAGVSMTNYGLAIAAIHGILARALEPFGL